MSKTGLVGLLVYAGGILLGFELGTVCLEKRYSDLSDREIESYRESTQKRIRDLEDKISEMRGEYGVVEAKVNPDELAAVVSAANEEPKGAKDDAIFQTTGKTVDYTSYSGGSDREKALTKEELAEREFPQDDEPEKEGLDESDEAYLESESLDKTAKMIQEKAIAEKRKPYIISYQDFLSERDWYSKVCLTYYEDSDTLLDEDDSPVDDEEFMLGTGYKKAFGTGDPDPDIIYIRNDQTAADYEVTKVAKGVTEDFPSISFSSDD